MLAPALAGLVTTMTLIVAIGAQNAYVLRQGLLRSHVGVVVLICALSDALLIAAGVGGVGALVDRTGWALDVVRWLGVAFLLWYAAGSLRRAFRPESLTAAGGDGAGTGAPVETRRSVVGRTLLLTWLNPHVYLDTLLLIGSIASAHDGGQVAGRWWFGVGAALGSVLWFSGLGFGARLLAPLLARPRAWQVVELCIAATMVLVALKLATG
ncbi:MULTISPECIES: LysE/ArgO family amino acid transporter [Pimelobacter]|uniref:LysE/ArgO family amino acid transporter n=1 Tax=Pimelobacter TaxID=2044 RepID=UPI001C03C358|nr:MULTISPECIES: LysE/ArgO family amino acid transporter [Pimelobacter]UUW89759.1 LysE/ArgO family amino acid transporter [Pimelobacter simplex]UUW93588.1 LysE/ArgO family amino acid transporter [Pimelobacter simplex]